MLAATFATGSVMLLEVPLTWFDWKVLGMV
jgi:hypothetical protein